MEEHRDFGATLAHFAHSPVILALPTNASSWLADRLDQFGECPAAFLLKASSEFPTKDLQTTAKSMHWFGTDVAFFDPQRLRGARIGLIRR
jgi:hypothetical protein